MGAFLFLLARGRLDNHRIRDYLTKISFADVGLL